MEIGCSDKRAGEKRVERGGSSRISEKKKKEKKRIDSGTELNEIAVGPDAIQALRELFKSWGGRSFSGESSIPGYR